MWDPAYNSNPSAQQRRRPSDLSTRPAADRDTLLHAAFGAKQLAESAPVQGQGRDPAADVPLERYNNHDSSDMSYQNGYLVPSSQQQPNSGSADYIMRSSSEEDPIPPPSISSSREAFALGPPAIRAPVAATPISHQHQEHLASNNNINNIPLEIDIATANTSSRPSSNSYPVRKNSDAQDKAQIQPITLVSSESYNMPPPLQASTSLEPQDQPSTPPASAPPPLRPLSSKSPRNTRDTSPCIARLTIPPSHMSLFHDALTNPPDPDLKIRKKTVRFNKISLTNSSHPPSPHPKSEPRHERRESEGSGSHSTSSKTSSSSHSSSSKATFGKTSSVPQVIEKDPEERMAELMELKQMKIRQDDLLHLKDQVFQTGQNLEEKQTILDEVRAERKVLHGELNRYIAMVKQVQKDLELATEAETQLTKERDQLSQYLTQLRNHDFKVLKEEVDQLRAKKGLRPVQSLEQEQEEVMGRYLEERRGQWREDGTPQDPSFSSLTIQNASGSGSSSLADAAVAADTSSRRQGAGSSSGTAAAAVLRSSRSHTSSTTALSSASRGRDRDSTDSRSNRSLQSSSSTHSRNHSSNSVSSSKSKQEQPLLSSSSRHSNSRSSSRRQSSRSRSRSPVTTSSRDERSKKRSRY